jgi:hypothetical protein
MQAAEAEAKGGKIVRWERRARTTKPSLRKTQAMGVEINANGKVLNKHDESKEHK